MLDNKQIFQESLANHIFFASSIRSFCTTIGLTFFKNNQDYIDRAVLLGYRATDIINLAISYMDKEIADATLNNNVYITPYTQRVEDLTEKLFGVDLVIDYNKDIEILKTRGEVIYDNNTMTKIDELNNQALILVNDFQNFCKEIRDKLDAQELFSYLYPDFFDFMHEAIAVYGRDIERILSKKDYTDFYLEEYAYYFNELLRKTAEYVRGFLDTSHQDVFDMATFYIDAFSNLIEKYLRNKNDSNLNLETERLVENYKGFLENNIKKLLNAELYFITPPVALDNFLTIVNVYLLILRYARAISQNN